LGDWAAGIVFVGPGTLAFGVEAPAGLLTAETGSAVGFSIADGGATWTGAGTEV